MKPKSTLRSFLSIATSALLTISYSHADTFVWDNSNVAGGAPPAALDWFTGGANPLGLWTGVVVPVSDPTTTIQFFANTTTALTNTVPSTQTVNLNNGGSAFQLGTLTLNGLGSATSGASLTMTHQGDALNFSGATGTISFNSVKNVAPASDTVINYNINNNIQLGTASSASALTLNGGGDNAGTTTYNIVGAISELQTGGGSILKSGTNNVTVSGALNITGGVTVSAGALTLSNNTNTASSMTVNGGTLILTGALNPASASMTVNTGGILRIGNNTATQFGPSGVYSGNISTGTGGTLQLWSSSAQTLSGIISGSGGINKAYGGALTLSNSNTYTGRSSFIPQNTTGFTQNVESFNSVFTNVGLGTVHSASSTLGAPTTVANGTIDVGGNAQASITLNYTGAGETTDRVVAVAWNGNSTQTIKASGGGLLKFTSPFTAASSGGTGSLVLTGAGNGEVNGITGSVNSTGLSKTDTGTWTISGPSTFSQPTTITGGILNLSSATALQNSPFSTASSAGTGSLGLRTTTTTLTLGGLTGANPLKGRFTTATGGPSNATANGGYDGLTNLTLNTVAGANHTYTGAIVEGATGMTLTKTGAGFQTLGLGNTYTGTTSVNGGLLTLNGNTLTGGLSVSNGTLLSNSSFGGVSSVTSSGVIAPGASLGTIGTLTINNASASALTLGGSTGIFDLPATVTTPDQIVVTGGGGLVLTGTNTVLLQTPTTGVLPGTYDLMTFTGAHTGGGSLVFVNGSTTMGNASLSVSAGLVQLTVAAGGLAGTATFTGAGGTGATDLWNIAARWNTGVVPTGTTNITLAPTGTQAVVVDAATTIFSGDLTINPGVALQLGWTTHIPTAYNALGTPGTSTIFMHAGSRINSRNGSTGTFSDIVLLGDATVSLGESTQNSMAATFRSITGPYTFNLVTQSSNGAIANSSLSLANSVSTLNISGGTQSGSVSADAAGSIGSANVSVSSFAKLILNHSSAITDNANPIRINNGTLEQGNGVNVTAALSLPTRPIELNGSSGATINNANTTAARTLTLGGGISSTAAGAKTLTLGGANTGDNTISGIISNGTGTVAVTKTDAGKWVLSNNNTYTGQTTVANNGTLVLSGDNTAMTGGVVLSSNTGVVPKLHINSATALGTGTLNFGGGAATDTVQIDNSSAGTVNVSTANAITLNRTFTFVGTQSLNLGTGPTTIGPVGLVGNRSITVTANTLTLGGTIAELAANQGITKAGAGTLLLSGTGNSYTGASTVNAGTLATTTAVQGFGTNLNGISIAAAGTLSLRNDSSVSFTNGTSAYNIANSAPGATINVDRVTGTGSNTLTVGNLTTTSTAAVWGLNFTGANGVSLSAGTLNTPASTAGSQVHTITNNIAGGGSLTLASVFNQAATVASPDLAFAGTGTTIITGAITQTLADMELKKSGLGTLLLNGTNTYTGLTSVNAGTLGGTGTIAGAVTVLAAGNLAPGASVGTLTINNNLTVSAMAGGTGVMTYELGPIASSDKIAITGTLDIGAGVLGFNNFSFSNAGGLQNGTYKLITSGAAVTGTLDGANLTGAVGSGSGTLQITGNDLELVVTGIGAGTAYDTWEAINAPTTGNNPAADEDGDGVSNGLEFVLGGTIGTNDLSKLPDIATSGGNMTFTFDRAVASIDGTTSAVIEVGTNLVSWPNSYTVGANTAGSSLGVVVAEDTSPGFDTVTLTVPQAPDAKKFGRLKVVVTP